MNYALKFQRIDESLNTLRDAFETLTHKEPRETTLHSLDGAKDICAINMVIKNGDVLVMGMEGDYQAMLNLEKSECKGKSITEVFGVSDAFVEETLKELRKFKFVSVRKNFKGIEFQSLLFYVDSTHIKEFLWYA